MNLFYILFLWILMGSICAYLAQIRGRDPIAWFALGMLLGVIGLLILFILPSLDQEVVVEEGFGDISLKTNSLPLAFRSWYLIDGKGEQKGPVSFLALQKLYSQGEINLKNWIWSEGMEDWKQIEKSEEIKNALKN